MRPHPTTGNVNGMGTPHGPITRHTVPQVADPDFQPPCTADPDLWFSTEPGALPLTRRICNGCPVQDPCREAGRDLNEYGVWGGETRAGRERARTRRASSAQ